MGCGSSQSARLAEPVQPPRDPLENDVLQEVSHSLSLSVPSSMITEVEYTYSLLEDVKVQALLCIDTKSDGIKRIDGRKYCRVSYDEFKAVLKVNFPMPGTFKVAVFGTQQDSDLVYYKGYYYEVQIPGEKNTGSDSFRINSTYDDKFRALLSDDIEILNKDQLKALMEKQKDEVEVPEFDDTPLTQDEIEQLRQDLRNGVERKDRETLIIKTRLAEVKNVIPQIQEEYDLSQKMLATLRLRYRILQMEQRTMTEIRNYRTPPIAVHEVMIAALLLLGHHEEKTRVWLNCKGLLESINLRKRIDQFDVGKVHPEIAARSRQLAHKYALAEVCVASAGAGPFYNWIHEITATMTDVSSGQVAPANDERQKEIFNIKPPSPKWNRFL